MVLNRRTIRFGAATTAATMALIYVLIGLGVLTVITPNGQDAGMLVFGLSAGGAFLLGAVLLATLDRRWLWVLGAIFQVMVVWGYVAVAPQRTPAFEIWGITLRILQVPLFAALLYLALRPTENGAARR